MSDHERELDELMIAAQAGDETAYHTLLKALCGVLRRYFALRLPRDPAAVEDLVQEVLIAVHERRATYDPARPFAAWLFAIARYKLVDHLRASGRRVALSEEDTEGVAGADEEAAASARLDIERLLAALPERSREIVRSVKLEGRSVAEAALSTGASPASIRVLLHRALRSMAARLHG